MKQHYQQFTTVTSFGFYSGGRQIMHYVELKKKLHNRLSVKMGSDLVSLTKRDKNFTFVGPCIVIYFYSKTDQMHNISNLFILEQRSSCFGRSLRPSSGV